MPDFIGIHADILAEVGDAIKPEELCEALRCYTHNRFYRLRLIAGATRVDLNGQPAGFVTEKQEAAAKKAVSVKPSAPQPAPKEAPATPTNRMSLADLREAARRRHGAKESAH